MSIATEITRLQNAKSSIKTAIENKGVTVGDGLIDTYASKIDEISSGISIDVCSGQIGSVSNKNINVLYITPNGAIETTKSSPSVVSEIMCGSVIVVGSADSSNLTQIMAVGISKIDTLSTSTVFVYKVSTTSITNLLLLLN